jgi:integrase
MAGVDLRTVAELLGHRTLQMVKRCSHLATEHRVPAVAVWWMSEIIGALNSDTGASGAESERRK